jgi:hypothetical protein
LSPSLAKCGLELEIGRYIAGDAQTPSSTVTGEGYYGIRAEAVEKIDKMQIPSGTSYYNKATKIAI